ncbi:MAG: hypothetical protein ACREXP_05880 [Steroidobacteraceae bacterium]
MAPALRIDVPGVRWVPNPFRTIASGPELHRSRLRRVLCTLRAIKRNSESATANGADSVSVGRVTQANGASSVAVGDAAVANGDRSIAIGYNGAEALSIGVQRRVGKRAAFTLGGAISGSERSGTLGVGIGF